MALQWIGYLKQSGWMDLLKIGGVASIVSSVVTFGWNEFRNARIVRREARHAALTVAISLERYARDAQMMRRADWAGKEAVRERRYDRLESVTLVEFMFPEPIDWKWLSHKVASQLREFPASLHSTRQSLAPEMAALERTERAFTLFYTGTIASGAISPVIYGFLGDRIGVYDAIFCHGAYRGGDLSVIPIRTT